MSFNREHFSNFDCLFVCSAIGEKFRRNPFNYLLFIYLADRCGRWTRGQEEDKKGEF